MLSPYYSLFPIITSSLISLFLLFRLRKNSLLETRAFFWHYALGFFIWGIVLAIPLLINLRIGITYSLFEILSVVTFFALLLSYILFYRGTILLFTKHKFVSTVYPFIFLPFIATLAVISLFIIKIEPFIVLTAVMWGFLFPINIFLVSAFLYLFVKGSPSDTVKGKPHTLVLSFSWFFIFALNIILWFNLASYPHKFWSLRLAAMDGWYIARTFAHLLMLIGLILYCRYLGLCLKTTEKD